MAGYIPASGNLSVEWFDDEGEKQSRELPFVDAITFADSLGDRQRWITDPNGYTLPLAPAGADAEYIDYFPGL